MGRSYTLIHFPCLGMARVGCSITNSYLDRGASRKGGIPPQPYLAILSFQMIGNFSLQSYFRIIITSRHATFHQSNSKPLLPFDQRRGMKC